MLIASDRCSLKNAQCELVQVYSCGFCRVDGEKIDYGFSVEAMQLMNITYQEDLMRMNYNKLILC